MEMWTRFFLISYEIMFVEGKPSLLHLKLGVTLNKQNHPVKLIIPLNEDQKEIKDWAEVLGEHISSYIKKQGGVK